MTLPDPRKKTVVLDTNFLLLPYQFTIDIFSQLGDLVPNARYVLPAAVVDELEQLGHGKGKDGAAARFALVLLARQKLDVLESGPHADIWILDYARLHRAIVCTGDRALRQRIKRLRLKCIVLKGKGRLGWDG